MKEETKTRFGSLVNTHDIEIENLFEIFKTDDSRDKKEVTV